MSEFIQKSFKGGINLIVDDTRLEDDEYREAFNVRSRFDILDQIHNSEDITATAPRGNYQGLYTFGDYLLLFCNGLAYYQLRDTTGWQQIPSFLMDGLVPRMFLAVVPVNTTTFGRTAAVILDPFTGLPVVDGALPNQGINLINVSAGLGNLPGVIVQDGRNQPWFIYIDTSTGLVKARITQTYTQWTYDPSGVNDKREYVPIGTVMEWMDGILYLASADGNLIYRSVSGRPLDFVVNVTAATVASPLGGGDKGGDATTTAYSVGVGGITCLRSLNNGSLFVSCGNVISFAVTPNREDTIFGEPKFTRKFLFGAGTVNDRSFVDVLGDAAFIDKEGLRSFNAVLQLQNEGRNSIFSLKVSSLFKGILQDTNISAAIVFDNYALFGVNTIYGYTIIVYDTLNECFPSIDLQTNFEGVKQFAKIDTNVTQLYCITSANRLLKLYSSSSFATATVRTQSICTGNPRSEIRLQNFRCILSKFRENSRMNVTVFVNNRLALPNVLKPVTFVISRLPYTGSPTFEDVDSQISNLFFTFPNNLQGWKVFMVLNWTGGGSITNMSGMLEDITPLNPLKTQSTDADSPETIPTELTGPTSTLDSGGFPVITNPPPLPLIADFSFTPQTGEIPLTVAFSDLSQNALSWSWNFGDGSTGSLEENPSYTYQVAGDFVITLTVTGQGGQIQQKVANIHVAETPPPPPPPPIDSPDDISTLVGWYKGDIGVFSDLGVTPSLIGGFVRQWNDQSGNLNHIISSGLGTRPTYVSGTNGKPAVNFALVGGITKQSLLKSGVTVGQPVTIFSVAAITNINGGGLIVGGTNGSNVFYTKQRLTAFAIFASPSSNTEFAINASLGFSWALSTSIFKGGNSSIRLNSGIITGTGSAGNVPMQSISIGENTVNEGGFIGSVAEVLIYAKELNSTEIAFVELYLKNKYNL